MRRTASALLAALAAPLAGAPALAHHSQAAFDASREITFEGTVTRLDWKNPHIYLIVETDGLDGVTRQVQIEGLSITQARVDGLREDALPVGARVVVRANPNRFGNDKTVRGLDVTTADGTVHPFYQSARSPVLTPADSLAGRWAPSLAGTNAAFAAARAWPYTEAGRAVQRRGPLEGTCYVEPIPFLAMLNELREIEVSEGEVVFRYDNSGDEGVRVVHLGAEHPADVAPSLFGHAVGRWDGDTLVIDTVAFEPNPWGLFAGVPSSAGKRTVERLALAEDRLRLRYEITVEDPVYLSGPATLTMLWDHRPDLAPSPPEEDCDPAVAHRYLEE